MNAQSPPIRGLNAEALLKKVKLTPGIVSEINVSTIPLSPEFPHISTGDSLVTIKFAMFGRAENSESLTAEMPTEEAQIALAQISEIIKRYAISIKAAG
jgi:hypothetical protein